MDVYLFYQYDYIKWSSDPSTKPTDYIVDPSHIYVTFASLKTFIVDEGKTCALVIFNDNDSPAQVEYVVDMIHYKDDPKTVALVIILPLGNELSGVSR